MLGRSDGSANRKACLRLRRTICIVSMLALLSMWNASCASRPVPAGFAPPPTVDPLRLTEVMDVGDPARRASLKLVIAGLDADASGDPQRALGSYDRAVQVDPTNPYAFLAIARHHADSREPERALSYLDKAESLLEAEGGVSPRVAPHLTGLRGQALFGSGRIDEGSALLQRAWDLAPAVWTDGQLSAEELRGLETSGGDAA